MMLSRRPRHPALVPLVESLWVHRAELRHRFERALPTGRMQLLVNLDGDQLTEHLDITHVNRAGGSALQGARAAPVVLDTSEQRAICGVSFLPGGALPFLAVPASAVTGQLIDLSELWGRAASVLRERLLETMDPASQLDVLEIALLRQAHHAPQADGAVERACALLVQGARISAVRDHLGLAPKDLIDRFRKCIGLPPKLFARVARFQRLIASLGREPRWADAALEHGFADQAHLIREFTGFAGVTPTAYRARSPEAVNHCPVREIFFNTEPRRGP